MNVSFRGEFASKINELYRDTAIKRKSMDVDWRRIQGYMRSFIEEISDVKEFACATITEDEAELVLAAEGHELAFQRRENCIDVLTDGEHYDFLFPTTEGFCVNYEDKKLLEVIDDYMRAAFSAALAQLK